MSKKLNVAGITNELRDGSAFFPSRKPAVEYHAPIVSPTTTDAPDQVNAPVVEREPTVTTETSQGTSREAQTRTSTADNRSSNHASKLAGYQDDIVETIRKSVKEVGKEVTFVRLTLEEKRQLADIAYTYKRQGVKTSENEVSRVAINYVLEDYKAHGQESILSKVIAALLA